MGTLFYTLCGVSLGLNLFSIVFNIVSLNRANEQPVSTIPFDRLASTSKGIPSLAKDETEKCEGCEKDTSLRYLKMDDAGLWFCKNCLEGAGASKEGKTHTCPNCLRENTFKRKPRKPISDNIVGYCKFCGHVIWAPTKNKQNEDQV